MQKFSSAIAFTPAVKAIQEEKGSRMSYARSEKGVSWGLVGASVRENGTVENIERLFQAAKGQGFDIFISPHYLYPHDQRTTP